MRSIGKWNIKKLKKIVTEEMENSRFVAISEVRNRINNRTPDEWYDIWESAWSEIEKLIADFINDYQYGGAK